MAEGGEEVGGGDVDGSEVGGAGSAVCEGAGDDLVVDAVGVGRRDGGEFGAAEGGFDGEGVVLEPVEEAGVAEEAGVGVLGGVDVGVYWMFLCVSGVCWGVGMCRVG